MTYSDLTALAEEAARKLGDSVELVEHHAAKFGGVGEFATFRNGVGWQYVAVLNGHAGVWSFASPQIVRPSPTRDGHPFYPSYS